MTIRLKRIGAKDDDNDSHDNYCSDEGAGDDEGDDDIVHVYNSCNE